MADRPEPTSHDPDDPEWVDDIVSRALERAMAEYEDTSAAEPRERPEPALVAPPEPAPAPGPRPRPRPDRQVRPQRESVATATLEAAPEPDEIDVEPSERDERVADDPEEETVGFGAIATLLEWAAVIVGAFVVALLIKSFLVQPFWIPSSSMEPTLSVNDRVLVNKLSYDLHDVNRGDVVVFKRPATAVADEIEDLIKRVIALPGESVGSSDGTVVIDGRLLDEPYLAGGMLTSNVGWVQGCANSPADSSICTVPEGHVFVMGDNRSGSSDSRRFGPIDEDLIVGRAFLKVWPLGDIEFL